jgi:predicted flavoprotein YhiN
LDCDIAIVGAGAAGLMAAIQAGRRAPAGTKIVLLDGASRLGAKILVAGGGRCNVTHDRVDESAFAGSSKKAIRKVLLQFDVEKTIEFFRGIGVELKREETGKLFPRTDDARTILDALLSAARDAGVQITPERRIDSIQAAVAATETTERVTGEAQPPQRPAGETRSPADPAFTTRGGWGAVRARRVILATGGRSLPKSGSDGHGHEIARVLGHTTTPLFPALVPFVLPDRHFVRSLSGLSAPVAIEIRTGTGSVLARFEGPLLCTHFGISGPAVLDASRHWIAARAEDPDASFVVNWIPDETTESIDARLRTLRNAGPGSLLESRLPDRLAISLCEEARVNPAIPGHQLTREMRRSLSDAVTRMRLPIVRDRGFDHAEVTAGGVPLSEIRLETMESRIVRGLHLCGEICDVDGRIGGYNFQWAWASGTVAGIGAIRQRTTRSIK